MNVTTIIGRLLGFSEVEAIDALALRWDAPWLSGGLGWLILGAIALAAVSAWFYLRYQPVARLFPRVFLITARALAICGMLAILAQPVLVAKLRHRIRPALWFVIDDTQSMQIKDEVSLADSGWSLGTAQGTLDSPGQATPKSSPAPRSVTQVGAGAPETRSAEILGADGDGAAATNSATASGKLFAPSARGSEISRRERIVEILAAQDDQVFKTLSKDYRLRFFRLRRADGLDLLSLDDGADARSLRQELPKQLQAEGEMTALGSALADIARRKSGETLAAVVLVSDFNSNAGPPPETIAPRLDVPLFCLGVGKTESLDLAVELQLPPFMKKAERSTITVFLRQRGLTGTQARVALYARRPEDVAPPPSATGVSESPRGVSDTSQQADSASSGAAKQQTSDGAGSSPQPMGQLVSDQVVNLTHDVETVEIPYTPAETGQVIITAMADAVPGEKVVENNRAVRDAFIREYYVRVLFLEDEPSWEWRFIKEVFHRDPLVGPEGFRTYLRSADPQVRTRNPLFLTSLSLPRREFFTYDVVIIGDIPASAVTPTAASMIEEFVDKMGGGLIFVLGPRCGPGQWADTPLGRLLPVEAAPVTRPRESLYVPQLTLDAMLFDFMRLGKTEQESQQAWANLGQLVWYYPVRRLRPLATPLLVHPHDTCIDGKTKQPLIAVQNVGRGEVVYVGINELWRLRRKYGETYYREFWGQLIHRLAIRHALGAEKRFVVRSDHREYRSGDEARFTVEAYDVEFRPLEETQLPERGLRGTLRISGNGPAEMREVRFTQTRPGWFESRTVLFAPGEYQLSLRDPLTGQSVETRFQVSGQSVELQQPWRNEECQKLLAATTGGKSYHASQWPELVRALPRERQFAVEVREIPLWNSWPLFLGVITLLLSEWFVRKWLQLR